MERKKHGTIWHSHLQDVAQDQLQRLRFSDLPGFCHEIGGQAG
jgi:hypothetical protein